MNEVVTELMNINKIELTLTSLLKRERLVGHRTKSESILTEW
jgi:hypothetical protein